MKGSSPQRFVVLLVALAVALSAPVRSGSPDRAAPAPRLAVVIVADGLAWDDLAAARPAFTSGLKRLLEEGQVERACRYRHLNTETGPGHASLGTGAPPRVHGIVANDWYEADAAGKLRRVNCTDGPAQAGQAPTKGPSRLMAPTLGDRLVEQRPGARVVSISAKDRAAMFLAGRSAKHAAYWYDYRSGRLVTSPDYDPSASGTRRVHAIVAAFNDARSGPRLAERYGKSWRKLDAGKLPAGVAPPPADAELARYQDPVVGIGFDHDLANARDGYFRGFRASPLADDLLTDLALAILGDGGLALGRGAAPDLLLVSYSANDYVAHAYGPGSSESLDLLRRLDLSIGRLLDSLDRRFGKDSVAVALSSDHGMSPIPEVEKKRDPSFHGRRLITGDPGGTLTTFEEWLSRLLDRELCLDPGARPVRGTAGWHVYYDRDALPLRSVAGPCGPAGREVTTDDLDAALPRLAARFFPEDIQEVLPISAEEGWASSDPASSFARNSLFPGRSGDAIVIPREGVQLDSEPPRGTGHGSHHERDIHVPLVFWGARFAAGVSDESTTPYDLAPTLAKLLGVRLSEATGRPLAP